MDNSCRSLVMNPSYPVVQWSARIHSLPGLKFQIPFTAKWCTATCRLSKMCTFVCFWEFHTYLHTSVQCICFWEFHTYVPFILTICSLYSPTHSSPEISLHCVIPIFRSLCFYSLWIPISAAHMCMDAGLATEEWATYQGLHKNSDSPSTCNSHQLSTAPQLRVGTTLTVPFPNHAGILSVLILCRSCAGIHSCCEHMSKTTCKTQKTPFFFFALALPSL